MTHLRFLLLQAFLLLSLAACRKEAPTRLKAAPIDVTAFEACRATRSADSAALVRRLAGHWKWTKYASYWDPGTYQADQDIVLLFREDGRFFLVENAVLQVSGTWSIRRTGGGWVVDCTEPTPFTYGYLLLCDDALLFQNSSLDGTDNQFERVE